MKKGDGFGRARARAPANDTASAVVSTFCPVFGERRFAGENTTKRLEEATAAITNDEYTIARSSGQRSHVLARSIRAIIVIREGRRRGKGEGRVTLPPRVTRKLIAKKRAALRV